MGKIPSQHSEVRRSEAECATQLVAVRREVALEHVGQRAAVRVLHHAGRRYGATAVHEAAEARGDVVVAERLEQDQLVLQVRHLLRLRLGGGDGYQLHGDVQRLVVAQQGARLAGGLLNLPLRTCLEFDEFLVEQQLRVDVALEVLERVYLPGRVSPPVMRWQRSGRASPAAFDSCDTRGNPPPIPLVWPAEPLAGPSGPFPSPALACQHYAASR